MATIVIRVDITVTSPFTKTTLPGQYGGPAVTLNSTSSVVDKIAEINRQFWRDQFEGVLANPDPATTISTQTVT